jgi:mono/diheme cytochrome c family protein
LLAVRIPLSRTQYPDQQRQVVFWEEALQRTSRIPGTEAVAVPPFVAPAPIYRIALPRHIPPGAEKPFSEADLDDQLKKGFYLVTIGHCMECHTPMGPRGREFESALGKGGFEFKGPWGTSVSRNITSHKEKGIGAWSDDEIKRAITDGIRRDGTRLKPPMGFEFYKNMTEGDLNAIVAYLRTVPAQE